MWLRRSVGGAPTPCRSFGMPGSSSGAHAMPHRQSTGSWCGNLIALPLEYAKKDPLLGATIRKSFSGMTYQGQVISIDADIQTGERAYHIVYEDGDEEHLVEKEVRSCLAQLGAAAIGCTGAVAANPAFGANMGPAAMAGPTTPAPASRLSGHGAFPGRHSSAPSGGRTPRNSSVGVPAAAPSQQVLDLPSLLMDPRAKIAVCIIALLFAGWCIPTCWRCAFGIEDTPDILDAATMESSQTQSLGAWARQEPAAFGSQDQAAMHHSETFSMENGRPDALSNDANKEAQQPEVHSRPSSSWSWSSSSSQEAVQWRPSATLPKPSSEAPSPQQEWHHTGFGSKQDSYHVDIGGEALGQTDSSAYKDTMVAAANHAQALIQEAGQVMKAIGQLVFHEMLGLSEDTLDAAPLTPLLVILTMLSVLILVCARKPKRPAGQMAGTVTGAISGSPLAAASPVQSPLVASTPQKKSPAPQAAPTPMAAQTPQPQAVQPMVAPTPVRRLSSAQQYGGAPPTPFCGAAPPTPAPPTPLCAAQPPVLCNVQQSPMHSSRQPSPQRSPAHTNIEVRSWYVAELKDKSESIVYVTRTSGFQIFAELWSKGPDGSFSVNSDVDGVEVMLESKDLLSRPFQLDTNRHLPSDIGGRFHYGWTPGNPRQAPQLKNKLVKAGPRFRFTVALKRFQEFGYEDTPQLRELITQYSGDVRAVLNSGLLQ